MQIKKSHLYQRQTTLKEFGEIGQQKLADAKVTIIGCGGLGGSVAVHLAASGVGNLTLVDFDVVSVSNLHRQVFYRIEDVGKPKVQVLKSYLEQINPFVKVIVKEQAASKETIFELIEGADIVVDCTDILPIKYLINDACILKDTHLVYGSLYKFDGYVASFSSNSTNLRDAFPEIPKEHIPNCAELGTLNPIVGIISLMQANEVIKKLTGLGKTIENELLIYNALNNTQFKMKLQSKFSKENIQSLFQEESYLEAHCDTAAELEISKEAFEEVLDNSEKNFELISVIEDTLQQLPFEVDDQIPLSTFDTWLKEGADASKDYIFICNRGISSLIATQKFKEAYPTAEAKSLAGGILEYA